MCWRTIIRNRQSKHQWQYDIGMMGVNMGYQPSPVVNPGAEKLYARMPVKTDSGERVWLNYYWKINYVDIDSFKSSSLTLTEEEYTLWLLANPLSTTSYRPLGR